MLVAELETQESEQVLDVALLALVVGTQGHIAVYTLPPELAHSSCAP